MGYGGGGSGGGGSGGSGGGGGSYTTVGGGSAFGDSSAQELPSLNQAPAGSIRFNTDSKKLEVYILGPVGFGTTPNGIWMEVDSWSPDLMTGGTRGVYGTGFAPTVVKTTEYINLASTGNGTSFGDLANSARFGANGCASRTRGIFAGGATPTRLNDIDTFVIASTGSATDFGNLREVKAELGASSNETRGIFMGGNRAPNPLSSDIDYITIATTGTSIDSGGDILSAAEQTGGTASSTRAFGVGGNAPSQVNTIQFMTISSLGNTADFGDLTVARRNGGACSNAVLAVYAGGDTPTNQDVIVNGMASPTRGVWAGGYTPTVLNLIEYVQFASKGDAIDFGDTATARYYNAACSNGHGGLG